VTIAKNNQAVRPEARGRCASAVPETAADRAEESRDWAEESRDWAEKNRMMPR
jgi:hypothetical protein